MTRTPLAAGVLRWLRPDTAGVAFAALFFCLSLTPSLLPRDWLNSGIIGGINAAIGYGIGVVIGGLVRRFLRGRLWWPPTGPVSYGVRGAIYGLSAAATLLMIVPAAAWQRQVAGLMDIEGPATATYLRAAPVAVLTGGLLIGGARLIKDAIKVMARWMIRRWHLSDEVAMFAGTAIVVILIITLVNGVLLRGLLATASATFQPQNAKTRPGSNSRRIPKDPAARRPSLAGTASACRGAPSSVPARRPAN